MQACTAGAGRGRQEQKAKQARGVDLNRETHKGKSIAD